MKGSKFNFIGRKTTRKNGLSKVIGWETYSSDIHLPGLLHARVLVSPHPHAKVKRIDTREAEKTGTVCITFKETPQDIYCPRFASNPKQELKDTTVLTSKPLYVGDKIAAVAAETEEQAENALKLIKVKYEVLKPVLDPIKAKSAGNPKLHNFIIIRDKKISVKNNIAAKMEIGWGDVEKGFAESDVIIEKKYKTGRPYHAQLETKSVVCQPLPDGGMTVWATTQSIHGLRVQLGNIFRIPLNKINIKRLSIGGSFGSSLHMNSIIPICVALALKAKRPVKLVSTREEDTHNHSRYPCIIKYKLGAKKDGTLLSGKIESFLDAGAYNTETETYLLVMNASWINHYKIPNIKFEGEAVYTNKVPGCAFVGYGNTEITFAVESMLDEMAEKLKMDPIELKLKNDIGFGDMYYLSPTVKLRIDSCGTEEILKKGAKLIGWKDRLRSKKHLGDVRRGIGVAKGFHSSGTGGPIPLVMDYSGAMIKINEDGTVDLVTSLMDQGGGTLDAIAKVVSEELGVPLDNVVISNVGTSTTPYDIATHASRGTYVGGLTAKKVAGQVKQKLLEYASRILEKSPDALKIRPNEKIGQGIVYAEGIRGKKVTVGEIAETARQNNWGTIASVDSYHPLHNSPSFIACFIEVEVNTKTGMIKPVKTVIGCDSGTIINPRLAKGQLHGGFHRGAGYALIEDTCTDKLTGELLGEGYLTDFKMLAACDLPELVNTKVFFADTHEPKGPFGAKGIAEAAINAVPAAVANSIYDAIGIRFRELPITPEKVLLALNQGGIEIE